jgi:hypothetical protein
MPGGSRYVKSCTIASRAADGRTAGAVAAGGLIADIADFPGSR